MNRAVAHAVVNCLRFDNPAEPALSRLADFDERDWKKTYGWLDDSGLVLHFLQRLKELHAENVLPSGVRTRFQDNLEKNRRRTAEMASAFGALIRGFEGAGVQYVAEKGFALIPEYCPDAGLRHQLDLDFLVSRASMEQAQAVLRSTGYFQTEVSGPPCRTWELVFEMQPFRWPSSDDDHYSPSDRRLVELHFDLWESERDGLAVATDDDYLDRFVFRNWNGTRFRALSDEDTLMRQALHTFKNTTGCWCRPSCFFEIAHFLWKRLADETFWARFRERNGDRTPMADIVNFIFSMALHLFGGEVPEGDWANQPPNPALSMWIQGCGLSWALAGFPGNKLPLFFYPQFIRNQKSTLKLQLIKLFPIQRPTVLAMTEIPRPWSLGEARWRRWGIVLRRAKYHAVELLRFCWHYPRWRCALSRSAAGPKPERKNSHRIWRTTSFN